MFKMNVYVGLAILCLTMAYQCSITRAQSLEGPLAVPEVPGEAPARRVQSVNVPLFYDMVKSGSSLGINVLQGLVKVERGEEAERNGLTGRRPLSVRIFGIPVYERGVRVRPAAGSSGPGFFGGPRPEGSAGRGEEESEPSADLLARRVSD